MSHGAAQPSQAFSGTGIGRGIVIGAIRRQDHGLAEVGPTCITPQQLESEIERYQAALAKAQAQLSTLHAATPEQLSEEVRAFIESHLMMLQDEVLAEGVIKRIREQHCTAEWALQQQRDELMDAFEQMDDAYLSTRRDDVAHVADRVLRILLNLEADTPYPLVDLAHSDKAVILVVNDMPPAELVALHHQGLNRAQFAFVAEHGGPLSHTAVLARSLEMPAILGLENALTDLPDGVSAGSASISPTASRSSAKCP